MTIIVANVAWLRRLGNTVDVFIFTGRTRIRASSLEGITCRDVLSQTPVNSSSFVGVIVSVGED